MTDGGYHYLADRLAQGSVPPPGVVLPFDVIVLAAIEFQDVHLPGYEVLRVPLDDSGPPPTDFEQKLIRLGGHEIAKRVRAGKRVLVTCRQGRNRSGVLAGRALVELGTPCNHAIERIRKLRNGLTNSYFRTLVCHDSL